MSIIRKTKTVKLILQEFNENKEAISAIKTILKNIALKGLNNKDFLRAQQIIGFQSLFNLQTNDDYANNYSIPYLHGFSLDFYYQNNINIKRLSHNEFQRPFLFHPVSCDAWF